MRAYWAYFAAQPSRPEERCRRARALRRLRLPPSNNSAFGMASSTSAQRGVYFSSGSAVSRQPANLWVISVRNSRSHSGSLASHSQRWATSRSSSGESPMATLAPSVHAISHVTPRALPGRPWPLSGHAGAGPRAKQSRRQAAPQHESEELSLHRRE